MKYKIKPSGVTHGEYHFDEGVTKNVVSSDLEKEVLSACFKGVRTVTSVQVKLGQISSAFDRTTDIADIVDAVNYTPVTLNVPSNTDWDLLQDESLAYSLKTKQLTFAVSGSVTYNCYYIVDQNGNLLSVSAKLPNPVTKSSNFSGYYKLYLL